MAQLRSLTKNCGTVFVPGTEATLYMIPKGELNGWPATAADGGGTAPGDTKLLAEAFAYVDTVELGYWRKWDLLVDTGNLRNTSEGEIGGQGFRNRAVGFIQGYGAQEQEAMDCLLAYSGCVILIIALKDGPAHVVGNPNNPAFVESIEGDVETRVGYLFTMYANTGKTTPIYDIETLGLNLIPNS